MQKIILKIDGMTCSACSNSLEKYLNKQEKIKSASVNLVLNEALIEYDDSLTIDDLDKFVKEAGFKSLGKYDEKKELQKESRRKKTLIFFSIYSLIYLYISMGHMLHIPMIPILNMEYHPKIYALTLFFLAIPYLIYAYDIFKNGFKNIYYKSPNMDTLIMIGVFSTLIYSTINLILLLLSVENAIHNLYFESAVFIIYFIKLGRYIENFSQHKTKEAIEELVQMTPETTIIVKDKQEITVSIDEVKKGDILKTLPGTKIAVDGKVISGSSHVDESFLTGESIPSLKEKDASVYAGSINVDGVIYYEALHLGADSSISAIVNLVKTATNTKPQIAKLADRLSLYFVPLIMLIAILAFMIKLLLGATLAVSLKTFITVLVVACPCSLGLASPLSVVVALGTGAKNKILIKDGTTLEKINKIDTIVLDKTGTLTHGNFQVYKIDNFSDKTDNEILNIVASIEKNSHHPLANSFSKYESNLMVSHYQELAGLGLKATIDRVTYHLGGRKLLDHLNIDFPKDNEIELTEAGCSLIYIIENEKVIGLMGLKDTLRPDSYEVISKLQEKYKVVMLSGDNEKVCQNIAKELDINEVYANVYPEDKYKIVSKLGNHVMMIGDGINDAPALASASIGVSIASATQVAKNSADIILISNSLESLLNVFILGKKSILNIKENLFWAFIYNTCMIPIAFGLFKNITISPMLASIAMMASSITVVLNSLRLTKSKFIKEKNYV